MIGLRLEFVGIVFKLQHQIAPDNLDVEVLVRRVALRQNRLDRFAEGEAVFIDHALYDLELVDDLHASRAFQLGPSDWHDEANEAGSVEDKLVHENVQELDDGPLGVKQARNITEPHICLRLLNKIRKECLRHLLVTNFEAGEALLLIDDFLLTILGILYEYQVLWAVNKRREHGGLSAACVS